MFPQSYPVAVKALQQDRQATLTMGGLTQDAITMRGRLAAHANARALHKARLIHSNRIRVWLYQALRRL